MDYNIIYSCLFGRMRRKRLKKFELSKKGWVPATLKCSQSGFDANYNRPDNSAVTAEEFVKAVRENLVQIRHLTSHKPTYRRSLLSIHCPRMVMIHSRTWGAVVKNRIVISVGKYSCITY